MVRNLSLATSKIASFGKLPEVDTKTSDWKSYVEQLDFFFVANDITDAVRKHAILLSSCGADCYNLLCGLAQPGKPGELSYDELVMLMQQHHNPKPAKETAFPMNPLPST